MRADALQGATNGVDEGGGGVELRRCCGGEWGAGDEKREERFGDAGAVHVSLVEGAAQS